MCGRYVTRLDDALEREWQLIRSPGFFESFNVAPSTQVPIVRQAEDGREAVMVRWGLIPQWAEGKAGKYSTINARAETVASAASYRGAWKAGRRCLFPVTGFYEWQSTETGKQPWFIRVADASRFALGGLWERSGEVESGTIITLDANELLAKIHNTRQRMPLIVDAKDFDVWLNGETIEAESLIKAYPASRMEAWPVATYVNKPTHNDARCMERKPQMGS